MRLRLVSSGRAVGDERDVGARSPHVERDEVAHAALVAERGGADHAAHHAGVHDGRRRLDADAKVDTPPLPCMM
jgi:hypothetical protein